MFESTPDGVLMQSNQAVENAQKNDIEKVTSQAGKSVITKLKSFFGNTTTDEKKNTFAS